MQEKRAIIRATESVCPECGLRIRADVVQKDSRIYMEKACPWHGPFGLLLSNHPDYYRQLSDFYFSLMRRELPQHDYIVHLTNSCNLDCPICLAEANRRATPDYSLESLSAFLKGKKNYKIDLMGAEPTMRPDLAAVIKAVRDSGNIAALHTNGIKLVDYQYLRELKIAGLDEVHLQFDGFDDAVYELIRGRRLLAEKLKALENLEKLNISTDLVVTVLRGCNEPQMQKVLEYGARHTFVKEIFFLGCRFLGRAKELPLADCYMPDELIDLLESSTAGKISRRKLLGFQKLYFAFLSAFSVRKCFYINHYIVLRTKDGYKPVDEALDIEAIQANLEKFKKMRLSGSRWAVAYLIFISLFKLVGIKGLLRLKDFLSFGIRFITGFNLSCLPRKIILLGFISACDQYSFDSQIAKNCGKGAVSAELGVQDSGAVDNISPDRLVCREAK